MNHPKYTKIVFQSQFQSMYPSDDILKKYLLKLWIKKRLEEIRKNSTSSNSQPSSSTTLAPVKPSSPSSLCPDIYRGAPDSDLLCRLWAELEDLRAGDPDVPPPGSHPGLSPLLVLCPYTDHSSSLLLCQLWCQIQTFYNKVSLDENHYVDFFGGYANHILIYQATQTQTSRTTF